MQRSPQSVFSRNRLLRTLSIDDFETLRPHLQRLDLPVRFVLEEANEAIRHVYFPEPCVASMVATTPAGKKLEVGLFGPEGMSGLAVVQGSDRSPLSTFIQVAGSGLRLAADDLRAALDRSGTLHGRLGRYAQAYAIQIAYTALANGRYTIEERLARWLLMCHDRIDGNQIGLTHEFLALMLGVRRAGVTISLNDLEEVHIIRSGRGRIEILDRARLIDIAGGSYGVPEAEYERLIGSA